MPSRYTPSPEDLAQSATAALTAQIQNKLGRLPNAYAALAALQPQALGAVLTADASAAPAGLSIQEKEVIKLQVSALSGCEYCEAAHFMIGKMQKISEENLAHIRAGRAQTGNARWDALIELINHIMHKKGSISAELYAKLAQVGFTPAQLAEVATTIAVIVLTNVFNRINDTTLDFPPAP